MGETDEGKGVFVSVEANHSVSYPDAVGFEVDCDTAVLTVYGNKAKVLGKHLPSAYRYVRLSGACG